MKTISRLISLVALLLSFTLSACSSVHPHPPTQALSASIARTRAALTQAEHTASMLSEHDPATFPLREQLADLGVQFDALTGKVQWYQADWERLFSQNKALQSSVATKDATIATQQKVIHQTAKERDFYPWLIAFGVGWVMLRKLTPVLSAGLKLIPYIGLFLAMAAPEIAFALGAALGFTGARLVAAYGSRFLP